MQGGFEPPAFVLNLSVSVVVVGEWYAALEIGAGAAFGDLSWQYENILSTCHGC